MNFNYAFDEVVDLMVNLDQDNQYQEDELVEFVQMVFDREPTNEELKAYKAIMEL